MDGSEEKEDSASSVLLKEPLCGFKTTLRVTGELSELCFIRKQGTSLEAELLLHHSPADEDQNPFLSQHKHLPWVALLCGRLLFCGISACCGSQLFPSHCAHPAKNIPNEGMLVTGGLLLQEQFPALEQITVGLVIQFYSCNK